MKISYLVYEPLTSLADLTQRMERVAALGYQGIELTATHPLGFPVEAARELAERLRLPIVSLLSGWSYAHEGLCLCRPDAGARRQAVERLLEYVELAARLHVPVLVVGMMQGTRADEPDEAVANARIVECLVPVARAAHTCGVQIVLEPVNHQIVGFNNTAAAAAALADRVDSPGMTYMLDTIHMNIEERSVLDTIRMYGGRCRHFHLCESNGGPFGNGNLDFPAVLAALAESGYPHFVSAKVYRLAPWEEAAASALAFLRAQQQKDGHG